MKMVKLLMNVDVGEDLHDRAGGTNVSFHSHGWWLVLVAGNSHACRADDPNSYT